MLLLHLISDAGVIVAQSEPGSSRFDVLMNWNFMALPYASYAPETSWVFGVAGVGYFRSHGNEKDFGNIKFNAEYSLLNQWSLNVSGRLLPDNRMVRYVDYSLNVKHYPDRYYGIGNNEENLLETPVVYTHSGVDITVRPAFPISDCWEVGPTLQLGYNNIPVSVLTDSLSDVRYAAGAGSRFHVSPGGMILFDNRDNRFYPEQGMLFKVSAALFYQFGESRRLFGSVAVDFRHFVPLYRSFIFAYQFKTEVMLGNSPPFYMLPTIGGQDLLRGIARNKFRDNLMAAVQCEFRIPVWRFVKAAVFGAIGDVYNIRNLKSSVPEYVYGVGLRLSLHKVGTNIRFDAAWHDKWSSPDFYFTVEEAF